MSRPWLEKTMTWSKFDMRRAEGWWIVMTTVLLRD
jgi:hypothetical protein